MGALQIFTNAFPVHYSPPNGFHFEVSDADLVPLQVLSEIKLRLILVYQRRTNFIHLVYMNCRMILLSLTSMSTYELMTSSMLQSPKYTLITVLFSYS